MSKAGQLPAPPRGSNKVENKLAGIEAQAAAALANYISYLRGAASVACPIVSHTRPRVYLSIVCIAKNEGPYVREWLEYHKLVGVERVYFYDNESTDRTQEILQPYIQSGYVCYHVVRGRHMQVMAYNDALQRYARESVWMAFIDLDEFLLPMAGESVPEFLQVYERAGVPGVVACWVCFDCNGHEQRPAAQGGLVLANYTRVPRDYDGCRFNWCFKTLARTEQLMAMWVHGGFYLQGRWAADENGRGVPPGEEQISNGTRRKLRINHYYSKSREEYCRIKMARGYMGKQSDAYYPTHPMVDFKVGVTEDREIQRFLPRLKAALGIAE